MKTGWKFHPVFSCAGFAAPFLRRAAAVLAIAAFGVVPIAPLAVAGTQGQTPIYLGVLEAPHANSDEPSNNFHVRIAFRFRNGRWAAMPHDAADEEALAKLAANYPPRVAWTIVLHGQRLGEVTGMRPRRYSRYSDIGLEELASGSDAPKIPQGAETFGTWLGEPRYRPLIAISTPTYDDPDKWSTFAAPAALMKQARAAFKQTVALDFDCNGRATRDYRDSAIELYSKPYRSKSGDVLIAMRPDPKLNRCEGPAGDEWQSVWFQVKAGKFRWLGNGLTLIDVGAFGRDGASEIVFQSGGYDRDGYVLLNPRDDSKIEFSWSYQ